jgi:hypothetical protein
MVMTTRARALLVWILLGPVGGCATGTSALGDEPLPGLGGQGGGVGGTTTGGGPTAGGGTGGAPLPCGIDCALIATPVCTVSQCNEESGNCEVVPDEDGTSCEDGQFCTADDSCQDGLCVAGPPNDCNLALGDCEAAVCNEQAKQCDAVPKQNGVGCTNSANLCLLAPTCQNGQCVGAENDCFYAPVPDECHVAVCNPQNGKCEPQPGNDGAGCTDPNDLCTLAKTCAAGACQGGSAKDCSALTQGCNLGVCNTLDGKCTTKAVLEGQGCDDLDACTSGETCQAGQCQGGAPVVQCKNADNCCPPSCNDLNDSDCAITDLDIGPFSTDYSSSSATRGYWFTAPVGFTIKELRVPTDVGTEPQNIQVVKFTNGPPPSFPTDTTSFQTLAYHKGVPGTAYIPVSIVVQSGDVIGILGARGTTTLHNSYSPSNPYSTKVFNQPMLLTRLVYQANVYSTPAGPLSTEAGGSFARIELRYGP